MEPNVSNTGPPGDDGGDRDKRLVGGDPWRKGDYTVSDVRTSHVGKI